MALGQIANLFVRIGADISGLKSGLADARGELNRTAQQANTSARGVSGAFGLIGTATLVATGAVIAFREAMKFAEAAAELELLQRRFANMADEVGTTADLFDLRLRLATQGYISDAKAASLASQVLSLQLVNNARDAARLARVASLLNQDLGELTLALTNQTTRRFDQLNVSVQGFEHRLQDLEDQGYSTEAAFTEAFLQQAERQIERVGTLTGTLAAELARATANWEDFKNSVLTAGGVLQNVVKYLNDQYEAEQLLLELRDRGIISQTEFTLANKDLSFALRSGADILDEYIPKLEEYLRLQEQLAVRQYQLPQFQPPPEIPAQDFSVQELGLKGGLGQEISDFQNKMRELSIEAATLRAQIAQLTALPYLSPEQEAQLSQLRGELNAVTTSMRLQAIEHQNATRQILLDLALQRIATLENLGTIDAATANTAKSMVYQWAGALGLMDETTIRAAQSIDNSIGLIARGQVQEARQQIQALTADLLTMQGDYYVNIHLQTFLEENPEARFATNFVPPTGNRGPGLSPPIGVGGIPPLELPSAGGAGEDLADQVKEELDPGRLALQMAQAVSQIGSLAAGIIRDQVIDPLNDQIDAIDRLVGPGYIDITAIDRTAELERDRAEAAERVAAAQEKILRLEKEQQRLQFLESQLRLLDLIEQNKLNAKDILGDIDLGIGADPFKIVEATTRALQELISRSAGELGISVPNFDAGEALGGGGNSVNVYIEDVSDAIDIEDLALRVADVLQYRNP